MSGERIRVDGRRQVPRSGRWHRRLLALAVAFAAAPLTPLSGQDRSAQSTSARIVAYLNEPREPELGDVFQLDVQIRVAPDVVAFLSDTMTDAENSVSAGPGTWTVEHGPGDSLDVRATYPVMSFLPGGVELPFVELWTRPARPGEEPGIRPSSELPVGDREAPDAEYALLYLGGVFVMPPSEMVGDGATLEPRPPADVLGGDTSPWLVAAIAVTVAAAGAVAWLLLAGRAGRGPGTPTPSARDVALHELDRIRELGWHTNGHVVAFYDATTGVLRHYAERRKPHEWPSALTSSELLARLAEGRDEERLTDLRPTIWTAECVKFGSRRPDAETAERDWAHVREWIAGEEDES